MNSDEGIGIYFAKKIKEAGKSMLPNSKLVSECIQKQLKTLAIYLISNGYPYQNYKNLRWETTLHLAIKVESVSLLKVLLAKDKLDVNAED